MSTAESSVAVAQPHAGENHHQPDPSLAHHFDTREQQFLTGKLGMWTFLATELLMFGGLFCAYSVYRHNHPEVFDYAHHFLNKWLGGLNTLVLITSSLTMAWGVRAAQMGNRKLLMKLLALTLIGAAGFMVIKSIEWDTKWRENIFIGDGNLFYHDAAETKNKVKVEDLEIEAFHLKPAEVSRVVTTTVAPEPADPNAGTADQAKIVPPNITPAGLAVTQKQVNNKLVFRDLTKLDRHHVYTFFTIYFLMTGLHGIHVLVGMGLIFWILVRASSPSERTWVIPSGLVGLGVLTGTVALIIHATVVLVIACVMAAVGLIWMAAWTKSRGPAVEGDGEFSPIYFQPVDLVGLYWHLVDLIWIFLFPLLYLIH